MRQLLAGRPCAAADLRSGIAATSQAVPTSCRLAPSSRRTPVSSSQALVASMHNCSWACPRRTVQQAPLLAPPCRITNTSKELYTKEELDTMELDKNGEEMYMELPDPEVFDPELGPLELRVEREFLDALAEDRIDVRETNYWFTPRQEGWKMGNKRFKFMEQVEVTFPQPWHDPDKERGVEDRIRLEDLQEGVPYLGVVTDVWLYHGVQIDFGAEFDGLIPISEEQWKVAKDVIDVGEPIWVFVHQVRAPGLYRWPIQLTAVEQPIQEVCMDPEEYNAPIDHAWADAQGYTMEDVMVMADRPFTPPQFLAPEHEDYQATNIQEALGTGNIPYRTEPGLPIEDYLDSEPGGKNYEAWSGARRAEVDSAFKTLRWQF